MARAKLLELLQVAGNLGLIAGLILVGIQITDSNRIASAELFGSSVGSVISINTEQLGDSPGEAMSRVLYDPAAAETSDLYIADRIYDALLRQLVRVHVFDAMGLYGDDELVSPAGFVGLHFEFFACPYGLAWLDQQIELFDTRGNEELAILTSLKMLRELAGAESARVRLEDRLKRVGALLARLDDS